MAKRIKKKEIDTYSKELKNLIKRLKRRKKEKIK